jgi:hypothetical protein
MRPRQLVLMALALHAPGPMANEVTMPSPSLTAAGTTTQGECLLSAGQTSGQLLSAPDTLKAIRCFMDRGQTALGILLLQQLLAADELNKDAALLLEEQLGKATKPSPAGSPTRGSVGATGWLAAELGHDSNINRATSATAIDIPLLNYRSLSLPELMVQRPSSFAGLSGGATVLIPITQTLRATVHGQAGLRGNFSELAYLPHNYLAVARFDQDVGSATIGIGGSMAQQWVAKFRLLERSATRIQVAIKPTADVGVALSAELARNIYPLFENLGTRENMIELRGTYQPLNLQFGAYRGAEASRNEIKDLDRTFDGISIGWRYPISESIRLAIDASSGRSRYGQFSRLFATQRSDHQTDLSLALQIRLADGWSAMPKLMAERNDSSMVLNQYRRTQYLVELRKDF